MVFLKDAIFTLQRRRRISLLNRQRDYLAAMKNSERLALHHDLNSILAASNENWQSYDYGEGYFYQGLRALGVTGFRDTEARVEAMQLRERVSGKRVLEIGSNTGFLSLCLNDAVEEIVGFDVNPYLIEIAERSAKYLDASQCRFFTSSFEDFECTSCFDCILSFANHSTYDGNTKQDIEPYFRRCRDHLSAGGVLYFESHPPAHEGEGLELVVECMGEFFLVEERTILDYGGFLDRGRTFIVARRRD